MIPNCYPEFVVKVALAEVGYMGKGSASADLDSPKKDAAKNGCYTKYGRDMDALKDFYNGRKQGHDWCCLFAQWSFVQAYGRENAQKLLNIPDKSLAAGVKYAWLYFYKAGRVLDDPKIGEQIFFRNRTTDYAHTGIVVGVDANYVWTVEGNVSVKGYREVVKKKYSRKDKNILGYGVPDYSEAPKVYHIVEKGDSLWKLSKKFYGTGTKWKLIANANDIKGTVIRVGQKLVIPPPNTIY